MLECAQPPEDPEDGDTVMQVPSLPPSPSLASCAWVNTKDGGLTNMCHCRHYDIHVFLISFLGMQIFDGALNGYVVFDIC